MRKVAQLSDQDRQELFNETAARMQTVPAIIEKDFWVVWVLDKLFSHDRLKNILQFKGGTSLSKVYDVIGRFSEDVDLVLDWREVSKEDPAQPRKNKTQQNKFNAATQAEAAAYIAAVLLPEVSAALAPACSCTMDAHNAHAIHVAYPALNATGYLRPAILLEIGPLASWTPSAEFAISSYAAQQFPDLFEQAACQVPTILAKRTFWEKATILHQEAHRPADKVMPSRYSRHYYDLALLANSTIKNDALSDLALLEAVVAFKQQFYPSNWARYDLAKVGSLQLMPPEARVKALQADFDKMQEMIFAKHLAFDEVLATLKALEDEINTH